jgi:hypothetical protein
MKTSTAYLVCARTGGERTPAWLGWITIQGGYGWAAGRKDARRYTREDALEAARLLEGGIAAYYAGRPDWPGGAPRVRVEVVPATGGAAVTR